MAEDESVTISETTTNEHNESTSSDITKPIVEKDEDELFRMRAKLFRWAKEADPAEWKERGTGDVTLLKHKETSKIRLLMRREKTYKTCANHYLDPSMKLTANIGSDRAWVWTAHADFADEEPKEELLAIRFLNSEIANNFKDKFIECQDMMRDLIKEESTERILKKLSSLAVDEDEQAGGEKDECSDNEKDDATKTTSTSAPTDSEVHCSGEKTTSPSDVASPSKTSPAKVTPTEEVQEQKQDTPEK